MLRKMEVIWSKLTKEEKNILRKIHFRSLQKIDTLSHEYEYLKTIRLIKEINKKTALGIPLLSLVIERENRLSKLKIQDNRIYLGKKEITNFLARQERALMLHLL